MADNILPDPARLMVCLLGLAFVSGMLPDIDHPIRWLLGIGAGRFLHAPFAILGLGLVGIGSWILVSLYSRLS